MGFGVGILHLLRDPCLLGLTRNIDSSSYGFMEGLYRRGQIRMALQLFLGIGPLRSCGVQSQLSKIHIPGKPSSPN